MRAYARALGRYALEQPQSVSTLQRRHVHYGGCTAEGISRYAARFQNSLPRRVLHAAGWSVPRVVFGGDDYGTPAHDRMGLLHAAVTQRGINMCVFDGDSILSRSIPGSDVFARRPLDRMWETTTLRRLFSSKLVQRDEMIIAVQLQLGKLPYTTDAATVDVGGLQERLQSVLRHLGLQQADLLLVQLPAAKQGTQPLAPLLQALERMVGHGYTQYYGIVCDTVSGSDSSASAGAVRVSELLAAAHNVRGTAYQVRQTCTGRLGNHVDAFPEPSTDGTATPPVAAPVSPVAPTRHHLAVAAYSANLLNLQPLLPGTSNGPRSVAQELRDAGILQLLKTPLDCVASGKPFRCADADAHTDQHPRRLVPLLNDTLNFAIHLEQKWEGQVRQHAIAEDSRLRQSAGSTVEAAAAAAASSQPGAEEATLPPVEQSAVTVRDRDVAWARVLAPHLASLDSLLQWTFLKRRRVIPAVDAVVSAALPLPGCKEWATAYRLIMGDVTGRIDVLMEQQHAARVKLVCEQLDSALPQLATSTSLTARVLRLLLATSFGADCVMTEVPDALGLRRPASGVAMLDTPAATAASSGAAGNAVGSSELPLRATDLSNITTEEVTSALLPLQKQLAAIMTGPPPAPPADDPAYDGVPLQTELKPRPT